MTRFASRLLYSGTAMVLATLAVAVSSDWDQWGAVVTTTGFTVE